MGKLPLTLAKLPELLRRPRYRTGVSARKGWRHAIGERAMKRKEAIDELREIQEIGDLKVGHRLADDVLCRLLHSLG